MSLIETFSVAVSNFCTMVADGVLAVGYGAIVLSIITALAIGGLLVIVKVVYPGLRSVYEILKDGVTGDNASTLDSKLPLS